MQWAFFAQPNKKGLTHQSAIHILGWLSDMNHTCHMPFMVEILPVLERNQPCTSWDTLEHSHQPCHLRIKGNGQPCRGIEGALTSGRRQKNGKMLGKNWFYCFNTLILIFKNVWYVFGVECGTYISNLFLFVYFYFLNSCAREFFVERQWTWTEQENSI